MTFTPEQVERIVLEVIRRLELLNPSPPRERGTAVVERSLTTPELKLTDKVITMRSIEGRLTGINRLVVAAKAIVTPAVKDELKKHKVELIRQ